MEIKKPNDYSSEEKKKILLQWWYSDWEKRALVKELDRYDLAGVIGESCAVNGMVEFMKATDNIPDILFKTAAFDYELGDFSDKARNAMLKGSFYDYCAHKAQVFDRLKDSVLFGKSMDTFIYDMVGRYNRDFSEGDQLVDRILRLSVPYTEFKWNRLCASSIGTLYNRCLLNVSDLEDEKFRGDFTVGEGIEGVSYFSTDKLNSSRDEIMEMISRLPKKVKDGVPFDEFCVADNGYKWGTEYFADKLIKLGTATGLLYFPAPREDWQFLPGGMPYIATTEEDVKVIPGHKAYEYAKVKNDGKGTSA